MEKNSIGKRDIRFIIWMALRRSIKDLDRQRVLKDPPFYKHLHDRKE
jgi:hypothetical protein